MVNKAEASVHKPQVSSYILEPDSLILPCIITVSCLREKIVILTFHGFPDEQKVRWLMKLRLHLTLRVHFRFMAKWPPVNLVHFLPTVIRDGFRFLLIQLLRYNRMIQRASCVWYNMTTILFSMFLTYIQIYSFFMWQKCS